MWSALTAFNGTAALAVATESINGTPTPVIYIGSGNAALYAFNTQTSAQLWTAAASGPIISSPAGANGVVYVGAEDNNLYAYALNGPLRPIQRGPSSSCGPDSPPPVRAGTSRSARFSREHLNRSAVARGCPPGHARPSPDKESPAGAPQCPKHRQV